MFSATMWYSRKSDYVGNFKLNVIYFINFGPRPCLLLNDAKKM